MTATPPEPVGDSASRPAVAPETATVLAGRERNGAALAPTIVTSSTFVTPSVAEGRRLAEGEPALAG
ncbi:MAG TPA: hypothetical protein PKC57_14305, partial [Microthrixaceae bacterium]|nr:hypothetical protein [Microthrixaceae bacterium]